MVSAVLVLMLALWVSAALEARLLAGATDNLSIRKMAANALRAVLLFVGLMFALSAAGIDLTALGVLGGALGVGIGFGLQKLAANYVSGFVILAERSMRIGDLVKVDNFEGRITDISTRYTVIRALNGRESIVPNEMMITQRVENASLADTKVAVTTDVQVAYGTDLDGADAAHRWPRWLACRACWPTPRPAVLLTAFAADGLNLRVAFWIGDPRARPARPGLRRQPRAAAPVRRDGRRDSVPAARGAARGGLRRGQAFLCNRGGVSKSPTAVRRAGSAPRGRGAGGRRPGSSRSAAFTIRCADTGAVMNRNSVISSSCRLGSPCSAKASAEATSTQPTPSVVALLGPCRRLRMSLNLASPHEPTSAKPAPPTSSAAMTISAHNGSAFIRRCPRA